MTTALEDIKQIDLEEWLTLATAPSPTKLKQGQSPNMQNVWTDEKPGSIITANGLVKVGTIPSNNPVTFCINYFKTSAGSQTFVVSDNATVWTTIDFQNFTQIISGLSSSFQLRGAVIRDKLWLTNGSDHVRTFDGTTVTVLDGSGSTPNVPTGRFIAYHDERVWLYHVPSARSAVYFSSLTDSSANIIDPDNANAWDTTDNFLQISEGDADYGTGMFLYRGYLHFFKQYSIWRLVGYDEYTYSRVKTRSSTGTRFNEAIQELDSLIHLIGVDGIYVFDGEESVRISDIIDPSTASQTAFGFNQLQQPNTNNQFWEVTDTADWNTGTVPTDLAVDNSITLQPSDDSQADFQAGTTLTNIDTTTLPGSIQATISSSGHSSINSAINQPGELEPRNGVTALIGNSSQLTDGVIVAGNSTNCGFQGGSGSQQAIGRFHVPVVPSKISRIILRQVSATADTILTLSMAGMNITAVSPALGHTATTIDYQPGVFGRTDITIDFTPISPPEVLVDVAVSAIPGFFVLTEIEVYSTAFNSSAQFISKTLDLAQNSSEVYPFYSFVASETLNGETTAYFTQSSADGISWDAPVSVLNGGFISSVFRRFWRWGVNITTNGANTPVINLAIMPTLYLSAIHDTGGNIFSWGPFESDYSLAGQTITFYYRGATTSGGISAASWNKIVPGGVLGFSTTFQFIQFKIEIPGGEIGNFPSVTSVTINWVKGSAGQPQTLQNVASAYWRNRYWLSAAGPGATENNTILIRGKKTFESPWMLKNWNILSFTRYFDSLYGGSSVDGSIYQLDTGYSLAGVAMDSYFETGDFFFGGFTANFVELLIEVERLGAWTMYVGVSIDSGNTWDDYPIDLTPNGSDTNFCKRLMGNIAGMDFSYTTTKFRLRFRTNGVDTPFQVHRCIAFYKLSAVRGSIKGDYIK